MQSFNKKEYSLYKKILGMTQPALRQSMAFFLKKYYKDVVVTNDYILAQGDIPIALCAHMDTVFPHPPRLVFYDRDENVILSPEGCGHDDRAGIFMIMQIIGAGFRPHVVLTTDEEIGCVGADKLVKDVPNCPFDDLKYVIQLDRRGADDCVFYYLDNDEFVKYVETFGFVEAKGSFTDIVSICPAWERAGVNLSVGYMNEHTTAELLYVGHYYNTLNKVKNMLKNVPEEAFEYKELCYNYGPYSWYNYGQGFTCANGTTLKEVRKCACCHTMTTEDDLFPVIRKNGQTEEFCIECMMEGVQWCTKCNRAFESDNPMEICNECKEKEKNGKRNDGKEDSNGKA